MDSRFADGCFVDSIDNTEAVFIVNQIGFAMLKCNFPFCFSRNKPIDLLAVFVFLTTPVFASTEINFECPLHVVASSANVTDVLAPWKLNSRTEKIKVKSADFSDGPPAEMAILKPYDVKEKKGGSVVTWKFEGDYPQGKWLSCGYVGNLISLSQELPKRVSECKITYGHDKKWGGIKIESIVCKQG